MLPIYCLYAIAWSNCFMYIVNYCFTVLCQDSNTSLTIVDYWTCITIHYCQMFFLLLSGIPWSKLKSIYWFYVFQTCCSFRDQRSSSRWPWVFLVATSLWFCSTTILSQLWSSSKQPYPISALCKWKKRSIR